MEWDLPVLVLVGGLDRATRVWLCLYALLVESCQADAQHDDDRAETWRFTALESQHGILPDMLRRGCPTLGCLDVL